jgi:hypothetical protein
MDIKTDITFSKRIKKRNNFLKTNTKKAKNCLKQAFTSKTNQRKVIAKLEIAFEGFRYEFSSFSFFFLILNKKKDN